ncbi:hypothetical protein SteCoe_5016 [Stentor coeruleus]|uniref:Uncharacterized protein n=1 Tax=Stentor coeruleus TaxID=5963 RepID=A0A1R2CTB2_9CILI|nr:hypothetical protein SteCoe_5016 [Stentor coeruleus]
MEEVADQIDRLNFALQQMMEGIPDTSIERQARMSLITTNWLDKDSDDSSLDIPDEFEKKVEMLAIQLDRTAMIVEDFLSDKYRSVKKIVYSKSELLQLVQNIKGVLNGKKCILQIGGESFEAMLSNADVPYDFRETTFIENSIMDCGHDIMKIRREIALDVEIKLQAKKNRTIEQAKANLEFQLEELDKLKQSYLDKLKSLVVFNQELEKREKHLAAREGLSRKHIENEDMPEDPQERLKVLESLLEKAQEEEEISKISQQIDQLKSKISILRAEKVISETKQTSNMFSKIVKAMEKEVSNDEKQRKKLLEKYMKKQNTESFDSEKINQLSLKKLEENFRVYMEKARNRIKKKEAEVLEKEKNIEENWMKVTGCKELIELMRSNIEKLNILKEENEKEREMLEREKLNIVNMNEKIAKVWAGIENYKKCRKAEDEQSIKDEISNLGINQKDLGFN